MHKDNQHILQQLGLDDSDIKGGDIAVHSPIDGALLAHVHSDSEQTLHSKIQNSYDGFLQWRRIPAPQRGELIRLFAEVLREHKTPLGRLITLECGKILSEGLGEVQEMIDICDFAVGLSRQLYGLTIASERPRHKMLESWHPMGVCGVISAFNFPAAVWAWNFALAIVCGDSVVWKPSEKTPLTAIACEKLFKLALSRYENATEGLLNIALGGRDLGEQLVNDTRIPIISATGSTSMGRAVGPRVAERFGRCILELGGNNAMIVSASADLNLATRAIVFSAVGTAGQRCTSLRRLIVQHSVYDDLIDSIKMAYNNISIGNPLDDPHLVGPLIDKAAYEAMCTALKQAHNDGAKIHGGQRVLSAEYPDAYYVKPALVEIQNITPLQQQETFAPILYCMKYQQLDEAITLHNNVPQGLASSILTNDLREAEEFLSSSGSDCGIANVNIGPSGAEIGGAFGGEKETGGGRESGSDAWRGYMRRQTSTINYSSQLPLAQGVKFEL